MCLNNQTEMLTSRKQPDLREKNRKSKSEQENIFFEISRHAQVQLCTSELQDIQQAECLNAERHAEKKKSKDTLNNMNSTACGV